MKQSAGSMTLSAPIEDEGYYLAEIWNAEGFNYGPGQNPTPEARERDAALVRNGYVTIDEAGAYRTTEVGRDRAKSWLAAHKTWLRRWECEEEE